MATLNGIDADGVGLGRRRARRAGLTGLVAAGALAMAAAPVGALAATAPHTGKSVVMVKLAAKRGGFKNVLTSTKGLTLYTAASCTGACLSSWPPLLMPSGKTVPLGPKGVTGLGTVKRGAHLQVTYRHHPLYTFTGDSGTSVSGNGLAGFTVIKNA